MHCLNVITVNFEYIIQGVRYVVIQSYIQDSDTEGTKSWDNQGVSLDDIDILLLHAVIS